MRINNGKLGLFQPSLYSPTRRRVRLYLTSCMSDDSNTFDPDSAYQARQWIARLTAQLAEKGIAFRNAPEEPISCCGRGCNGCVWESYFSAVLYWCEQARELLQGT